MKICVIGSGYVGLITACGFSKLGHSASCVDIDPKKVDMVNRGEPPIFENGLKELLSELIGKGLTATTDLPGAVSSSEIIFITVGTPSREDGSIDLSYIQKAFLGVLSASNSYKLIIVKSTVVPGTCDSLAKLGKEKLGKTEGKDYGLCMNPEFLREGKALEDFFNPDRIVVGAEDEKSRKKALELYSPFKCPILNTNRKTAEMIKYASNSFLATKISFSNEFGNLCKTLGIDVYDVMDGIGMDKRIGRSFLNAGIGYGGSCFPKDVKAIIHTFRENGVEPKLLNSVIEVNEAQPPKLVELAKKRLGSLKGKGIVVLGLAFKPGSDDIREAPSIKVLNKLLGEGAKIKVYDPEAMPNIRKVFGNKLEYATSAVDALSFSEIVFILTEWEQFKDEKLYKGKTVFDGRKALRKKSGGNYEGVCW